MRLFNYLKDLYSNLKTVSMSDILGTAQQVGRSRMAVTPEPRTAEGKEMLPEQAEDWREEQARKIARDELEAEVVRRFGPSGLKTAEEKYLNSAMHRRKKEAGKLEPYKAAAYARLLADAGPPAHSPAPTLPTLPTVPTLPAAPVAVKPATPKPTAAMLGSLIAGVFGHGIREQLDSKPLVFDRDFAEKANRLSHNAYGYAEHRKSYKAQNPQYSEQEKFENYRRFLFQHHIRVDGLDYSGCGPARPSPLLANQQAMAQKLADEFCATLQGNPFGTSTAARAAHAFAKESGIEIKS